MCNVAGTSINTMRDVFDTQLDIPEARRRDALQTFLEALRYDFSRRLSRVASMFLPHVTDTSLTA